MSEDQLIATQEAVRAFDPTGKFYGRYKVLMQVIVMLTNL